MDTIHSGACGKGGLLTMILPADDHKAFVRRLKDLRQETVHRALRSIARECRRLGIKVTHILTDNGSEFLNEKTIGQIFGATVYYTHAYASWEKGQLEQEILDNAWLTAPADLNILFKTPIADRWREAAKLIGVDILTMPGVAGHA